MTRRRYLSAATTAVLLNMMSRSVVAYTTASATKFACPNVYWTTKESSHLIMESSVSIPSHLTSRIRHHNSLTKYAPSFVSSAMFHSKPFASRMIGGDGNYASESTDVVPVAATATTATADCVQQQRTTLLAESLRTAYRMSETDGILQIAPQIFSSEPPYDAEELLLAAMEAVHNNRGQAAAIINALLGACSAADNRRLTNPDMAWAMFNALHDEVSESSLGIQPDIVTYCNVYTALSVAGSAEYRDMAELVLDRARRHAKKIGKSKYRRKLVSSARTKKRMSSEAEFQALYGSDFQILREDDNLVVVSKPSGMVCFHKHKTTAGNVNKVKTRQKKGRITTTKKNDGRSDDETTEHTNEAMWEEGIDISLEDAFLSMNIPLSTLNPEGMGIVHRLDRGTSGCIVLAKNDETHARLVTEFFTRRCNKSYIALVPFQQQQQRILATTKNDENSSENSVNHPYDEELLPGSSGMIDVPVGEKPAQTRYEVTKRYGNVALEIKLQTLTGRKHQVRIHCAKGLGRPIFLDPLYSSSIHRVSIRKRGNDDDSSSSSTSSIHSLPRSIGDVANGRRFFLHASSLSISTFGIEVVAPIPHWFEQAIQELEADET